MEKRELEIILKLIDKERDRIVESENIIKSNCLIKEIREKQLEVLMNKDLDLDIIENKIKDKIKYLEKEIESNDEKPSMTVTIKLDTTCFDNQLKKLGNKLLAISEM